MAEGGRKEFGRRGVAPPVVANAPQGLLGAPRPSPLRKRSLAIALISIGATSIGGYALYESSRDCASRGDQPKEDCHRSNGGHGGSGSARGWSFFGSGSSPEPSAHGSSSTAHEGGGSSHVSFFGGFGRMGFGHGGGS